MSPKQTSFDLQPILIGSLLQLEPLREEHFEELYRVAADPLIWEQHPACDRYKRDVFQQFFLDALSSKGALLARDLISNEVIGSSRYHNYNQELSEIEIGWSFLARQYWGGKYNGEMKKLMLNHVFQFVDKVHLMIGPDNHRSRKAAEKIGAVLHGERDNGFASKSLIYLIRKESWSVSPNP